MTKHLRWPTVLYAATLAMTVSGCVARAGWQYLPNPAPPAGKSLPVVLAVRTFKDDRPDANHTYLWLCMLPLVPYCTADYDRPDSANGFLTMSAYDFRPATDLANAAASEMRNSGLFRDVYVTDRSVEPEAQLMLRGVIHDTNWQGTRYAYMLGPYQGLLYATGLPIGSVDDTLTLDLQLVEQANKRVLWTYTVNGESKITESYYKHFSDDFSYPQIFRDGMKGAVESLRAYVNSQPESFWSSMPYPTEPGLPAYPATAADAADDAGAPAAH